MLRPDPIKTLLAMDLGRRGIDALALRGEGAAAARVLARARRVLFLTGFVVASGRTETDGPPGAVVLGRALRTIGKEVVYVTDPLTAPALSAGLRALDQPVEVTLFPLAPPDPVAEARQILARLAPTHLVAIERPGRARDGGYYNARGKPVTSLNAPADELFLQARRCPTIGIGDGGNEVGMGKVLSHTYLAIPNGRRIASVVNTDYLIPAAVSNWGAYGLVAYLSVLTGKTLIHTPEEEEGMIRALVSAGAVDGLTGQAVPTVDGLPLALHQAVVRLLREMATYFQGLGATGLRVLGLGGFR